jgi:predicted house-cleaning noncanonical NTP pyrophosphatase (MazG superfamily)
MKKYNKLVRDRIPEIIKKQGQNPVTRILDDNEYVEGLIDTLCEEVDQFDEDRNVEEMADILEVLMALAQALGISQQELKHVRDKKAVSRGSFRKRIFLERVDES